MGGPNFIVPAKRVELLLTAYETASAVELRWQLRINHFLRECRRTQTLNILFQNGFHGFCKS